MTSLKEVVERYLQLTGAFGQDAALEAFAQAPDELERLFSGLDEDYQISRFFHWSAKPGARAYQINGYPQTHIAIAEGIREIL